MANLTQLKMLENLNGFLLVDKPVGIAFSTVLKSVKRKFNLVKVGHGGSLDAMASGLFIVLINDANKFANDIMGFDREYDGTIRLGIKTNTHDVHGVAVEGSRLEVGGCEGQDARRPGVQEVAKGFRGDVFQTEPRFCSIRKEGSADYEIADTGAHDQFLTHVYRFQLGEEKDGRLTFSLKAAKSLIVRTLVNDFGEALGCGAALASLRRTKMGRFSVDDAIGFDKLLSAEMNDLPAMVKPMY